MNFTNRTVTVTAAAIAAISIGTWALWPNPDPPPAAPNLSSIFPGPPRMPDVPAPTGVQVTGVTASDATTLVLPDGKRVRLLGVVAPDAGGCHADEAVKHTREMLQPPSSP